MATVSGTFFYVAICGVLDFVSLTVAALRSVRYSGVLATETKTFFFRFFLWYGLREGSTVLTEMTGRADQWKGGFHRPAGGFTEWSWTTRPGAFSSLAHDVGPRLLQQRWKTYGTP